MKWRNHPFFVAKAVITLYHCSRYQTYYASANDTAVKGAISVYEIPCIITDGRFGSSTFVIQTTETAFKLQNSSLHHLV